MYMTFCCIFVPMTELLTHSTNCCVDNAGFLKLVYLKVLYKNIFSCVSICTQTEPCHWLSKTIHQTRCILVPGLFIVIVSTRGGILSRCQVDFYRLLNQTSGTVYAFQLKTKASFTEFE